MAMHRTTTNQRHHPYARSSKENNSKNCQGENDRRIGETGIATNAENCIICLESELVSDMYALPCSHSFHSSCIFKWFKRKLSCPICRLKLNNNFEPKLRNQLFEEHNEFEEHTNIANFIPLDSESDEESSDELLESDEESSDELLESDEESPGELMESDEELFDELQDSDEESFDELQDSDEESFDELWDSDIDSDESESDDDESDAY
ncbi:RING finger protein 145 homolog [Parasteatoda tepidariorum]|uniref:RING finger protein 145 homolog n=1 Tax=Parasteatoda tepidariorum TaxID=114398 RepID=UPI001C723323|nr:putative uncharacterized protein YGR160W [Parasteatoda tepidariorum]